MTKSQLFLTLLLSNFKQNLEISSNFSGLLRIYELFYKYYLDLCYKKTPTIYPGHEAYNDAKNYP